MDEKDDESVYSEVTETPTEDGSETLDIGEENEEKENSENGKEMEMKEYVNSDEEEEEEFSFNEIKVEQNQNKKQESENNNELVPIDVDYGVDVSQKQSWFDVEQECIDMLVIDRVVSKPRPTMVTTMEEGDLIMLDKNFNDLESDVPTIKPPTDRDRFMNKKIDHVTNIEDVDASISAP
eukprot:CAMPEP_0117426780 /NCGR_PEP_ID=MMETSP0758-20121206/6802_1 /TAXON_ID=63605 /ORGANISM="Percolomonas cosmopolitus, Strain AE-1 (ATCC 50343)" /LENGTH=179 /DNA_ID=CAMNT_0005212107 /DNA_START=53 /DNA_END=588 /DNA_ORIENTATION=+